MNLDSIRNGAILKFVTPECHWVTLWQRHDGAPIIERWGVHSTEYGRTEVPDDKVDLLIRELMAVGYEPVRRHVAE
jgi:hypothetical protein